MIWGSDQIEYPYDFTTNLHLRYGRLPPPQSSPTFPPPSPRVPVIWPRYVHVLRPPSGTVCTKQWHHPLRALSLAGSRRVAEPPPPWCSATILPCLLVRISTQSAQVHQSCSHFTILLAQIPKTTTSFPPRHPTSHRQHQPARIPRRSVVLRAHLSDARPTAQLIRSPIASSHTHRTQELGLWSPPVAYHAEAAGNSHASLFSDLKSKLCAFWEEFNHD